MLSILYLNISMGHLGLGLGGIFKTNLEKELHDQAQYLKEQDTEIGVSKDALLNYPTMRGIPTMLIAILTLAGVSYGVKKGVDQYILKSVDNTPQQEEIMKDTQEQIQQVFITDSAAIIDTYREDLSVDKAEEFEQFSYQQQRKLATDKNR